MYTLKQKKKAIKLYYQCNKHISVVVRQLGYPGITCLRNWVKEYETNGKVNVSYKRKPRFSKEDINKAIEYYKTHGRNITDTVKTLGYPCRYTFQKWLMEYEPSYKPRIKNSSIGNNTYEKKLNASIELCISDRKAEDIAMDYNVTRIGLYQWKKKTIGRGNEHSMAKKNNKNNASLNTKEELNEEISKLKDEIENLQKDVFQLKMEKDVLEKAAEIIKKDEGISLDSLTNKEKTIVIDALRDRYKLSKLLDLLKLSKSSYEYNRNALLRIDKYYDQRISIKEIFIDSYKRYGYRRIHQELKKKNIILSEKVIRRIMKEDGLIVYRPKKKKYSSYEGEITPAVKNLIKRDFHSTEPFEKMLTDLSEFSIPAGKVYLSPMIDCFDGLPLTWTIGISPNAELANTMLDETIRLTPIDKHPIIHSDRGSHYRWPGWIERMNKAGFIRSMSKKGCSPDNAACEAFFGTIKNEFFYCRDWNNISIDEFIKELDDYLKWFSNKRIKMSLGGLSPIEYRQSLGLI